MRSDLFKTKMYGFAATKLRVRFGFLPEMGILASWTSNTQSTNFNFDSICFMPEMANEITI
jgi:hypothetical protein